MAEPGISNKERADNYRLMAVGLQALAGRAQHGEVQVELIRLAIRYERLSQRLESETPDAASESAEQRA